MKEVLKEKFLSELTHPERIFFLRKAKDAIEKKGYPAGEDLFYYCYFLMLRERMRNIGAECKDTLEFSLWKEQGKLKRL